MVSFLPFSAVCRLYLVTVRPVVAAATGQFLISPFYRRPFSTKKQLVYDKVVKKPTGGLLQTMKVESHKWEAIITPEVRHLADLFHKYGYDIRIAGGAVRDIIQDKMPEDVDFATNASPDEMKTLFNAENVRMLNLKGEKHGTVTVRLNDKENFEITTLRIDVVTDGRHAEVEFTKDWRLDAGRRDLTFNSMFLELNGTLHDYFGGREDLLAKRVRFVGKPADRIQEDYLRILRYFRFYSRISDSPDNHCEATLNAIRENAQGLSRISGERIWTELRKFAIGRFAPELITTMFSLGLGPYMGFPETAATKTDHLASVYAGSINYKPQPVTIITALLESEADAVALNKRLKLSNDELGTILSLLKYRDEAVASKSSQWYKRLLAQFVYVDPRCRENQARSRVCELAKYCGNGDLVEELQTWSIPGVPVEGHDLINLGVPRGKQFGILINDLKQNWINSDFLLMKDDLLKTVTDSLKTKNPCNDRSPLQR